jgi:hypothetical protein
MSVQINFVKGHCGWDVVTLLPEGQIPASEELASAIKIVSTPIDGGLEVGLMGVGASPDEIRLRMVSSTAKDWIPMCGGMTQVIGKALVETFLREHFKVDTSQAVLRIKLMTASGEVPIQIDILHGKVSKVTTTMDSYLSYLYREGVEPLVLRGIPLLRMGTYAVIDVAALEKRHADIDFTRRDPGPHLNVVNDVLRAFGRRLGVQGVNAMLYDQRPEGPGQYRVFPRFYSDDLAAARLPWEFQCGTGSIAVAMTLAHERRLPFTTDKGEVLFEWGSYMRTRDPYGIRTSQLVLELKDKRVTRAAFSHSVIEILAEGRLTLPDY